MVHGAILSVLGFANQNATLLYAWYVSMFFFRSLQAPLAVRRPGAVAFSCTHALRYTLFRSRCNRRCDMSIDLYVSSTTLGGVYIAKHLINEHFPWTWRTRYLKCGSQAPVAHRQTTCLAVCLLVSSISGPQCPSPYLCLLTRNTVHTRVVTQNSP